MTFTEECQLRDSIINELTALGLSRDQGTLEPGSADSQAHALILTYLRQIIGVNAESLAVAFESAIGLREPIQPDEE